MFFLLKFLLCIGTQLSIIFNFVYVFFFLIFFYSFDAAGAGRRGGWNNSTPGRK